MADVEAQTVSIPRQKLITLVQMLAASVDILRSSVGNDDLLDEGTTDNHELTHVRSMTSKVRLHQLT